ncbi:uncharacterized protein LOC144334095 [Macaca mulatta]
MSVLGSAPWGSCRRLTRASTGTRRRNGLRDGPGAAAAGAPTAGRRRLARWPRKPPLLGHAQLSAAPVPPAARVGRDPAPGESGRPPRRGARAAPGPRPPARPCRPGPWRAREARPGRCLLLVRAASRGGQRRGSGRPSCAGPAHGPAPAARQLSDGPAGSERRRSPAGGTRAMPCEQPSRDPGISPANLLLWGPFKF